MFKSFWGKKEVWKERWMLQTKFSAWFPGFSLTLILIFNSNTVKIDSSVPNGTNNDFIYYVYHISLNHSHLASLPLKANCYVTTKTSDQVMCQQEQRDELCHPIPIRTQ